MESTSYSSTHYRSACFRTRSNYWNLGPISISSDKWLRTSTMVRKRDTLPLFVSHRWNFLLISSRRTLLLWFYAAYSCAPFEQFHGMHLMMLLYDKTSLCHVWSRPTCAISYLLFTLLSTPF